MLLLPAALRPLQTLRLPWIFSDDPEITADFIFSKGEAGRSMVELALGGRFSKFGLPRGAARAPVLEIHCEIVSPGELVSRVAQMRGSVDLGEVLGSYGAEFSREAFAASSPYVFKAEFKVGLAPGDYNVVLSIRDKELSIFSRRTLHVIVPAVSEADGIGDLKFCLGVGEALDSRGRARRVLDPNPWRQVGGSSLWELIVAYDTLGAASRPGLRRRHSIMLLRGEGDEALWKDESDAPPKKAGQVYLARLGQPELRALPRGIYVFKVELWSPANPKKIYVASKTFEVQP